MPQSIGVHLIAGVVQVTTDPSWSFKGDRFDPLSPTTRIVGTIGLGARIPVYAIDKNFGLWLLTGFEWNFPVGGEIIRRNDITVSTGHSNFRIPAHVTLAMALGGKMNLEAGLGIIAQHTYPNGIDFEGGYQVVPSAMVQLKYSPRVFLLPIGIRFMSDLAGARFKDPTSNYPDQTYQITSLEFIWGF